MRTFFADAPVTLLHCDLRLDNVVFGGDECGFIDFQLVRKGPAAYDVAYFMTSAMREDASADEEETALRAYHEALAVPQYTYEEFKRDYQRALMVVLAGLAGADDVEFGNERGENMMAAWMRRLTARAANVNPADLQLA
jgi:Ser/Thr protein kinase RdoA (MazF antagonist)